MSGQGRRAVALAILASAGLLAACGGGGSTTGPTATGAPTATPTPRPRPVVAISPTHGRVGTVVQISGTGFKPKSSLRASICAVDAQGNVPNFLFDCDLGHTVGAQADAAGTVQVSFTVRSIPHTIKGGGYHIGLGPITGPDPSNDGGADFSVDR
jgi:neocarzinostatin family protein